MTRPAVVVPGRFASSTSALRYTAVVSARALLTLVHAAGAEPVTVLPWPDAQHVTFDRLDERLGFADALLLPGGGDVDPARYGVPASSEYVYDVDALQDEVDLLLARWALDRGLPLLAVCRGMHVVNVACGGTLEQHMESPHRQVAGNEVLHEVATSGGWPQGVTVPATLSVSCYHHQRLDQLAPGLDVLAKAADGTIEAVGSLAASWFLGVQWHPEDSVDDPLQLAIVQAFVRAASQQHPQLRGSAELPAPEPSGTFRIGP